MNQVCREMLAIICTACVTWTGGCGGATNTVEIPANPELAPQHPPVVGSTAPETRTTTEHH